MALVTGTSNNGKDNALEKVDKDKDEQDDKRDSNSTVNSDGIVKRDSNSADINSDGIIKTDSNRADANSDGIVKHDSNSADVNSNGIARRDMNSADVNSDGIDKCNSVTGEIIDDNVAYLYRVTDRCGKVTYHVVYDTGEEKKVSASTLSFSPTPPTYVFRRNTKCNTVQHSRNFQPCFQPACTPVRKP